MSDRQPILPTRVIPAGETLPAPAPPPPPAPPPEDWWRTAPGPSGPPAPVPVDVHVHVTVDQGGSQSAPDPDPGPRWWQRIRWGYNLALATLSLTLAGPWGALLASVRDEESLAGAWVMAVIPLIVLGYLDNARRVEAAASAPDLWAPKWRAAAMRLLLWAAVLGTVLTLPITTLVFALTGVHA